MSDFHYEFGGPLGALMTTVSLPLVILYLSACVDSNAGSLILTKDTVTEAMMSSLPTLPELKEAAYMLAVWMAACVLLAVLLPGDWVDGER